MSDREGRSFLEAICANPDDDTTRLVYADWLDERGDTPRAEFIRVQIERAALPEWDPKRVRLLAREHVLLAEHEAEWRAELPTVKHVTWGEFRRGFVAKAAFTSFTAFREGVARCRSVTPVEAVEVRWPRRTDSREQLAPLPGLRELSITGRFVDFGDIDRLTDSPVLSTLRALDVHHAALGADGFRRLLDTPHLPNLKALRAPFNSVGNGSIDTLTTCTTLPALEELDLSEVGSYGRYAEDPIIDVVGAATLANWPGLSRMRSLTLSGNHLQRDGLLALLRSPHIGGLKRLTLRDNALTGHSMKEFVDAAPGPQLDVLDLGENVLEEVGAGYLARAACLRGLKVLNLDRCELYPDAARKLVKAPFFKSLRVLNVGSNILELKGLAALLNGKPAELHTLNISGCDLGDEGAAKLAGSAGSNALLEVDLGWNDVRDKGVESLGAAKQLRSLLVLRLTENYFTQKAADALVKSPLGKRLSVLELPHRLSGGTPPAPPLGPDDPIPF